MGMTPEEAHAAARRQFGNVTRHREEIYEMNGIRVGGRRDPGSPLRVSAASTRSRAFRPLWSARSRWGSAGRRRYSASCMRFCWRRCRMRSRTGSCASIRKNRGNPTHDGPCRRRSSGWCVTRPPHSLTSARAHTPRGPWTRPLERRRRTAAAHLMVTSDYFRTLRSEQFRGPGFQIEDEKPSPAATTRSGARRVVLSHTVWRARFNGDPS